MLYNVSTCSWAGLRWSHIGQCFVASSQDGYRGWDRARDRHQRGKGYLSEEKESSRLDIDLVS